MKDINIFLVRHGESEGNIVHDVIGQSPDTKLTDCGVGQAKLLGKYFRNSVMHFHQMHSSTYPRAEETATIVKNIMDYEPELNLTDALVEYSPGNFRGKKRSEIYADTKNLLSMNYLHMGFPFPNGDTLN